MHEIRLLLGPIVFHAALGAALAAVTWTAGLGIVALGRRIFGRPLEARDFALAYPFGLLAVVAEAFVGLVQPLLAIAGLAVLGAVIAHGVRCRGAFSRAPGAAVAAALRAAPFALGYALVCGFLLHGASRNLDSHALGDNATWVDITVAIRRDPWRIPDLVAMGYRLPRPESAVPIVDAALGRLVPLDYYLAGAALLPMFLIVSLAAGFGALRGAWPAGSRLPFLGASTIGLLSLAAVGYPSWVPESPPVALVLPLAFAVFWLASSEVALAAFLAVAASVAVCMVLTKIVAALVLAAVVAVRLPVLRMTPRRLLVVTLVALACVAAAAIPLLTTSGYLVARVELRSPPRPVETIRDAHELFHVRRFATMAPLAQLGGIVCLVGVLLRRRAWVLLAPLATGLAAHWLLSGASFLIALLLSVLLVAVATAARGDPRVEPPLAAAAILLGLGAWWFDTSQARGSFSMALLIAAGVVQAVWARTAVQTLASGVVCAALVALALAGDQRVAFVALVLAIGLGALLDGRERRRSHFVVAAAALAALAVGAAVDLAVAQSRGKANFGVYDQTVYPREYYAVWREVAHRSNGGGLVFSSQTGEGTSTTEGWNYYPAIGERQVYLAGWLNSRLNDRRGELRRRLRLNADVLTGLRNPRSLPGTGRYDEYLAVLRREEGHPPSFRRLYTNRLYALYEITEPAS